MTSPDTRISLHMAKARRGSTNVDIGGLSPHANQRLYRLGRELRLTDQILSADVDTVSIEANGPAPAWTTLDGDHISFSMSHMPMPRTSVDVAVWLGTNAHELGHVIFSPRRQSPLMRRVIEADKLFSRGLADLHNIVEDQRQERLLLAMFAPWRAYLPAALAHHLVADDPSAWVLMCGRTWLPAEVRQRARELFVKEWNDHTASEVARIVGEYQRLTDPGDLEYDEAFELLQDLFALFDLKQPTLRASLPAVAGRRAGHRRAARGRPSDRRRGGAGGPAAQLHRRGAGGA